MDLYFLRLAWHACGVKAERCALRELLETPCLSVVVAAPLPFRSSRPRPRPCPRSSLTQTPSSARTQRSVSGCLLLTVEKSWDGRVRALQWSCNLCTKPPPNLPHHHAGGAHQRGTQEAQLGAAASHRAAAGAAGSPDAGGHDSADEAGAGAGGVMIVRGVSLQRGDCWDDVDRSRDSNTHIFCNTMHHMLHVT